MKSGYEEKCLDCGKPSKAWIGAIPLSDGSGSVCGDCAQKRCDEHAILCARLSEVERERDSGRVALDKFSAAFTKANEEAIAAKRELGQTKRDLEQARGVAARFMRDRYDIDGDRSSNIDVDLALTWAKKEEKP